MHVSNKGRKGKESEVERERQSGQTDRERERQIDRERERKDCLLLVQHGLGAARSERSRLLHLKCHFLSVSYDNRKCSSIYPL